MWPRTLTLFALSLFAAPPAAAGDTSSLGPFGGSASAVWVDSTDPSVVLVGKGSEGLQRSTDGGLSFAPFGSGLPAGSIRDLVQDPLASQGVYALAGTQLFHSSDGGATWSALPLAPGDGLRALAIHPSGSPMLANTSSELWRSADGGATWTMVFTGTIVGNAAIAASDPSIAYVGSIDGVERSTDGGQTWSDPGGTTNWSRWLLVDPNDPDVVYNGGSLGVLEKSTDGGQSFQDISAGLPFSSSTQFLAHDEFVPGRIWTAMLVGLAFSDDGGVTWSSGNAGFGANVPIPSAMDFGSDGELHLATENGFFRTMGGLPWVQTAFPSVQLFDAVVAAPGGERLATSAQGVYGAPAGQSLAPTGYFILGFGLHTDVIAVDPNDPDRWIVGGVGAFIDNATVRVVTNAGNDVQNAYEVFGAGHVADLAFDPSDPTRMLGGVSPAGFGAFGIIRSTDGGLSWTDVPGSSGFPVESVAWDPLVPGHAIALGTSNLRVETFDGGATFAPAGTIPGASGIGNLFAFDPNDANVRYHHASASGLMRSDDGGASWSGLGVTGHARSDLWLHPSLPGLLAFSDGAGNVLASTDHGDTFTTVFSSPDGELCGGIDVDPVDGSVLVATAGASAWEVAGGIPYTDLGGETAGTGGFEPRHFADGGLPQIGNASWSLAADRLLGGSVAVFHLGANDLGIPFASGTLHTGSPTITLQTLGTGGTPGVGGTGSFSVRIPIPLDATLVGASLFSQVFVVDGGGPSGLALSNGLRSVLFD